MTRHLITASLISLCAFLLSAVVSFAAPVPDTGQTQSYTNTFGEDSDYSCNPHSYTDLGNGVVKDNVTGLEWQQATAPGTYTWQQAIDYCNNLSLGGKDDWRLPTIKELSTLVDSSIPYPGPTINTSYFPNTVASDYWSSTTLADNTSYAWDVYFYSGHVYYYDKALNGGYVRAVRGGQSSNNFVDNSDGTISDTSTGLMWQKATAPGTYTWEQALSYCENLTLGGHSDWRLPNRNELQSIVDYSRYNPAIDTTYFPGTVASIYWSSTTYASNTYGAWYVAFYNGHVYDYGKAGYLYVRAVRGGQCGSLGNLVISKSGNGTGIVTSTDGKIDCGSDCSELYDIGTPVTLHAAADAGSVFTGWSGGECSGTGDCTVSIDGALSVTAEFQVQTLITLSSFTSVAKAGQVILKWVTESEIDNAGFNIYRATSEYGEYIKINASLITTKGSPTQGASYEFADKDVKLWKRAYYKLEDIDLNGNSTMHGPVSAIPRLIYGLAK